METNMIILAIGGIFSGLLIYATAEVLLILREMAFSLRKNKDEGPEYNSIPLLSSALKLAAMVVWVACIARVFGFID